MKRRTTMLKLKFKPGDDVFLKVKVQSVFVEENSVITYKCVQLDEEGSPLTVLYAKEEDVHEQDTSFIY